MQVARRVSSGVARLDWEKNRFPECKRAANRAPLCDSERRPRESGELHAARGWNLVEDVYS